VSPTSHSLGVQRATPKLFLHPSPCRNRERWKVIGETKNEKKDNTFEIVISPCVIEMSIRYVKSAVRKR
jgi:hypothetical protein